MMERYCNKCGKLLGENATFCRYCGASVAGDVNVKRDKNSDENSHGANRKDSDTNMTADTNKNSDISKSSDNRNKIVLIVGFSIVAVLLVILIVVIVNVFGKSDKDTSAVSDNSSTNVSGSQNVENSTGASKSTDNSKEYSDSVPSASQLNPSSVTSSSTLLEEGYDNSPLNLTDNNLSTCWSEGVADYGYNESVTFNYDKVARFNGVKIYNGFQKSDDLYYKNGRVKRLRISYGNGNVQYIDVNDVMQEQEIRFDEPFSADKVTVYIDSVYEGIRYEDTCMSELWFF